MKHPVILLAAFGSIITTFLTLSLCGCKTETLSCIQPPLTTNEIDKTNSAEIAVTLEKLSMTNDLKLNFANTVKSNFDKLSDKNAALLLFLEAIDCYLKHGKIAEPIAKEMADIVRANWAASVDLQGTAPALTPVERSKIADSPQAELIYARLREFGLLNGN